MLNQPLIRAALGICLLLPATPHAPAPTVLFVGRPAVPDGSPASELRARSSRNNRNAQQ